MSWPIDCERGVDLSANQETLDIDRLIKANPDVTRWVLRAENAFGRQDALFPVFYDRLVVHHIQPDIYVWPDPFSPLEKLAARWKAALRGRESHNFLVGDFEWSRSTWQMATGKVPIRTITDDTWQTLDMAKSEFDQDVILYASARFWDENIRVHGREKDERFWVPNYPTPFRVKDNEWRQCRTFEECEQAVLGTARYAAFPRLGDWIPLENVIGWQFSERGRLTGYDRDLDLDLWKRVSPPGPVTPPDALPRLWAEAHRHNWTP